MASGYVDWHKRTYTDIIAQSIEKVLVDIGAVSVDELPVNIKAQDIDKMSIDITAQTVERLFIAQSYGAIQSVLSWGPINPGDHIEPVHIASRGVLIGGVILLWGDSNVDEISIDSKIDGNIVQGFTLSDFAELNLTHPYANIYFLLKHDASQYMYVLGIARGITFDEEYRLLLSLPGGIPNSQQYEAHVLYATR